MEKHEHIHNRWHKIFVNNFIGGIAWGLGATVGVAVFAGIAGIMLQWIDVVPFVGSFVADISRFVAQHTSTVVK